MTNDATSLVRAVLDKQKTRPFWFRLRSITFGYVPYVFDVRTRTEKYNGDGSIKGGGGASGIIAWVPICWRFAPAMKPLLDDPKFAELIKTMGSPTATPRGF